jgi:hypothetical protein
MFLNTFFYMIEPSQCNELMEELMATIRCCRLLLNMFQELGTVLSAPGNLNIAFAVPAAPAAVRLMLTVLQADSRLQLMQQQHAVEVPDASSESCSTTSTVHSVMMMLAVMVGVDVSSTLQACPAARELLLLPELLSCLALMLVASVLGLDTISSDMGRRANTPAASSGSAHSDHGDSGRGSSTRGGGRSGSRGSGIGSSGMGNEVRLDSLTPLSCSLFDILRVTKETVLQVARVAKSERLTTLGEMDVWAAVLASVHKYQVSSVLVSPAHLLVTIWDFEKFSTASIMLSQVDVG